MKLTESIIERLRKEQVVAHKAKQDRRAHRVYLSSEARKVYGRGGLYEYSYAAVHRWTSREAVR